MGEAPHHIWDSAVSSATAPWRTSRSQSLPLQLKQLPPAPNEPCGDRQPGASPCRESCVGAGGGGGCCCCRCLSAFRKFILLQKSPSASLPSLLAPLSLLPELCHESHLARKGGDGSPAAKTQGHAKSPPSPTIPSPPGWQSRGQPCSQACCPAQGTSRHPVPAELGYEHAEAPVDLPGGPDSKRRDVLTFPWARMVPMPIPPTGRVHLCPRSPPTRTRTGLGMADPANRFGPHADRWPRCALCSAFCKPGIPCPRMQFPAPSQVTHT